MTCTKSKITAIHINTGKCVGCCGCEHRCSEVFSVGDNLNDPEDCKSQVLPNASDFFVSHQENIEFAADKCVEQAISIEYEPHFF